MTLIVVLVVGRLVHAEGEQELDADRLAVINLLAEVGDLLLDGPVALDPERAHVHRQSARGNALLQIREVLGRGVRADERLVLAGPAEQAGELVAGGLDSIQGHVVAPVGPGHEPGAVEAADGPVDAGRRFSGGEGVEGEQGSSAGGNGCGFEELSSVHEGIWP